MAFKTNSLKPNSLSFVADIGGTNARFALVDLQAQAPFKLLELSAVKCADYSSLIAAINAFYDKVGISTKTVRSATIAVAGPVNDDWFEMTNNPWAFSIQAMQRELDFEALSFINDYAAIAWSIPGLRANEYIDIGQQQLVAEPAAAHWPVGIIGPGTGLGVGGFIHHKDTLIPLQTEGGHAAFAPVNDLEIEILRVLMRQYTRVSNERILSGPGLVNLYKALAQIEGRVAEDLSAADISGAAVDKTDALCEMALNHFCAILGSVAGDLALILGARAGIYLAGGILPRFVDFVQSSPFRKRFEAKGRFSAYNAAVPTRLLMAEHPGLLGSAAHELSRYSKDLNLGVFNGAL